MKMNGMTAMPSAWFPVLANPAAKPIMKQNPKPMPAFEMIHMGRRPIRSDWDPRPREQIMFQAARAALMAVIVRGSVMPTVRRTGAR